MAENIELVGTGDLRDGEMKEITSGGRHFLVARVAGQYYAADGRCPHMGGKLALGRLEGSVVTCPLHGSKFDLMDGKVVLWTNWTGPLLKVSEAFRSPRPLNVYKTMVENGRVSIVA
jgi:3-phenylpropionate/trans-cinnamate dioxygenase ferredoxin component